MTHEPPYVDVTNDARGAVAMSGRRILYLDDEQPLVMLLKRMLEREGHRVEGFTCAQAALAAFRAAPDEFDLVLSDMSMPGMNGIEFAQSVLAARPCARVVIATGHVRLPDVERARAAGVREVIQKPVSLDEMMRTVSRLLDHPEGAT